MAKFTTFFRDKPINSHVFETGIVYIGRDRTNMIVIDNLSIAPIHAIAVVREHDCLIKQIDSNFPLVINGTAFKEYCLGDQDKITLGKYEILYQVNSYSNEQTIRANFDNTTQGLNIAQIKTDAPDANLQIMEGRHIGRIIPIKKVETRLGHSNGGVAIITKKNQDFYISTPQSTHNLTLNQKLITNEMTKLTHNDIIRIDDTSMQFFLG